MMKVGLIPAMGGAVASDPGYIRDYMRTAEASGFDSVWVGEHPALPVHSDTSYPGAREGLQAPSSAPLPDPLEWLAFAAAHSDTMLLGTAILILPLHHPVVLAKRAATLDRVSAGRFRLGVGVGWNRQEFLACGAEWERRGERADESIDALRVLWRDDHAQFDGATVGFEPVYSSPKPVGGSVPILIGASGPLGARRAGRVGDGYLPFERDQARLAALLDEMRRSAEAAGRDPEAIEITAMGTTNPERIKGLAALGVHRMVFFQHEVAQLPALAARVLDAAG